MLAEFSNSSESKQSQDSTNVKKIQYLKITIYQKSLIETTKVEPKPVYYTLPLSHLIL